MPTQARLRFISLFVPNLVEAIARYQALLQVGLSENTDAAPAPHPFATKGPAVFQLGEVAIALYECDGQTTHAGDVGLGLESDVDKSIMCVLEQRGSVFWGPTPVNQGGQRLAIGMLPDRHFFEIVEPL